MEDNFPWIAFVTNDGYINEVVQTGDPVAPEGTKSVHYPFDINEQKNWRYIDGGWVRTDQKMHANRWGLVNEDGAVVTVMSLPDGYSVKQLGAIEGIGTFNPIGP